MEVKVVRYSDADLSIFKEVILKKIAKAKEEIDFYTEQIKNASESETQFASIDDGSITSERENMNQIVARMLKLISHLESALVRIENKSYGICRETGKLIPKATTPKVVIEKKQAPKANVKAVAPKPVIVTGKQQAKRR